MERKWTMKRKLLYISLYKDYMEVPRISQYRPQNTIILKVETPKKAPKPDGASCGRGPDSASLGSY